MKRTLTLVSAAFLAALPAADICGQPQNLPAADICGQPQNLSAHNPDSPEYGLRDSSPLTLSLDEDWTFATGDAASPMKDFTHGTEYFTYLCKARSADHSRSPIMPGFDDSSWQRVNLPHDWAVDLPFSSEASHSHGYKCIGWRYPENSVGWYRKHIFIPESDRGRQITVEFEGIYRDSEVFCNGFYLGSEPGGYVSRVYALTPYLNYGGDNVIAVRCDASLEEGWYYEGAGIYRHVRLHKAGKVAVKPYSVCISMKKEDGGLWTVADGTKNVHVDDSCVEFDCVYADASVSPKDVTCEIIIEDADGNEVEMADRPWTPDSPYLYRLRLRLFHRGGLSDEYVCRFGVRTLEFNPGKGLLVSGVPVKLKGANMHLDHAGAGVGVPDGLWRYRLERLREFGFNAVRCSHNCASPAMLDICDELGILVIDENRQIGINPEQLGQLRNMIDRDRNHPSVILWSIGNEEWSLEHGSAGLEIALRMSEYVHTLDSTRPTTYGNSGGPELVKGVDVFGYNYIVQNPIEDYHGLFPGKCAVGTEETSGCGTRGKYLTSAEKGWMAPLNRADTAGRVNVIEHGWKFYKNRSWGLGLFYWTGFDYRGEPNPMKWPATGSQFGIFDYCGFPKDEAFYLRAAWRDEPLVHICGPCRGEVWVYSNCDKVRLYAGGKSLGVKDMPQDGHLVWEVGGCGEASDGRVVVGGNGGTDGRVAAGGNGGKVSGGAPVTYRAVGYRNGRRCAEDRFPAALPELEVTAYCGGQGRLLTAGDGTPVRSSSGTSGGGDILLTVSSPESGGKASTFRMGLPEALPEALSADYPSGSSAASSAICDVIVLDIRTTAEKLSVCLEGAELLGWGNGDPAFKAVERPAGKTPQERNSIEVTPFGGCAQILVRPF